jgi:uncharacterized GH25 family protein
MKVMRRTIRSVRGKSDRIHSKILGLGALLALFPSITRTHDLTLEIAPLDDPGMVVAPRIQVLFEGKSLEGALVRGTAVPRRGSTLTRRGDK